MRSVRRRSPGRGVAGSRCHRPTDGGEGAEERRLPEISRFFGISIRMYAADLAPHRDPAFFAKVFIDGSTIAWPNDTGLDPVVLFGRITGREPMEVLREW